MSKDSGITTKTQTDHDDLQRELAGVDVGRMSRFLNGSDTRSVEGQKKKASERAYRNLLDQMLQDAEYLALYQDLGAKLGDAERDADNMLANIDADLLALTQQIAEMENDAARGPDGTGGRQAGGAKSRIPSTLRETHQGTRRVFGEAVEFRTSETVGGLTVSPSVYCCQQNIKFSCSALRQPIN